MASANNSIVTTNGTPIEDAAGNLWSIVNGQVTVNGVPDPATSNVLTLAYENGQVWQMNAARMWWGKTSPSDSWSPPTGTSVSPLVEYASANNSVLGRVDATGCITDANNDHWTITATGQVAVNGVADPTTANVVALAYENGQVWQENISGLWWSKTNAAAQWQPPSGTSASPVQANPNALTTINLPAGLTALADGQDNSDSFIFAGTGSQFSPTVPTLQFLSSGNSITSALIVNGTAANPNYGNIVQSGGNVEDDGGFQISAGRLQDDIGPNERFVVGANSTIDNGGSFFANVGSTGTFQNDATITLGPVGNNELYLNNANLVGGTIVQNGESDITYVGGQPPGGATDGSVTGTDFVLNGGILNIAWPGGFNGTIGPLPAASGGAAMGIFASIEIFNAQAVTKGDFNTTTGMLSLLDVAGHSAGSLHFAGNASGLHLNMEPGTGPGSEYLAINDQGSSGNGSGGNIPLIFHA